MIEDALDMSRIENNKFQIYKEFFDIRNTVDEVTKVMEFQTTQKNLILHTEIDDEVPEQIKSDQKRFRQILFNLIGNAVKFTFHGSITVRIKFHDGELIT